MAATIEYTSQRKAFGKSILDNQYVHYKLAEFQTEVGPVFVHDFLLRTTSNTSTLLLCEFLFFRLH